MSLRPKYQLNHAQLQGARTTLPAKPFTQLTTRRFPYPRVGTRAPDGMFPKVGNPSSNPGNPSALRLTDGRGESYQMPITPTNLALLNARGEQYQMPSKWPQLPGINPHYMLNRAAIQGVMPAQTYERLTGKITTAPTLPQATRSRARAVRAPALEIDWGTVFWGAVAGGLVTLGMVYGVIPAMAEWAAKEIKKR